MEKKELTNEEQSRVDSLLSSAKKFHYLCFFFAGISLAIASVETFEYFTLPSGGLKIPKLQTIVGIYYLVILFSIVSMKMFLMVEPFFHLDSRRVNFPWIALGINNVNKGKVILWILVPSIICGISTALALEELEELSFSGFLLSFLAIIGISSYGLYHDWQKLITNREDERGGKATFSIYLLYWIRTIRHFIFVIFFTTPVILLIPKWNSLLSFINVTNYAIVGGLIFAIRTVGEFKFVYRWIDKKGTKFGFPEKSDHYK